MAKKRTFMTPLIIASIIAGTILAKIEGTNYLASTTFVVNNETINESPQPGGGFVDNNVYEMMRSYTIISNVLFTKIKKGNHYTNLANLYLENSNIELKKQENKKTFFNYNSSLKKLNKRQLEVLYLIYNEIISYKNLKVGYVNRGQLLPTLEVYNKNAEFAILFSKELINKISIEFNKIKEHKNIENISNLELIRKNLQVELNLNIENELSSYVLNLDESKIINNSNKFFYNNEVQNDIISSQFINSELVNNIILQNRETNLFDILDYPLVPLVRITPPYFKYSVSVFMLIIIIVIAFLTLKISNKIEYVSNQIN